MRVCRVAALLSPVGGVSPERDHCRVVTKRAEDDAHVPDAVGRAWLGLGLGLGSGLGLGVGEGVTLTLPLTLTLPQTLTLPKTLTLTLTLTPTLALAPTLTDEVEGARGAKALWEVRGVGLGLGSGLGG